MKWLRWLRWTLVGIVVCVAVAMGTAWWALRQSLPQIEGTAKAPSLAKEAIVERDARGERQPFRATAAREDAAARSEREDFGDAEHRHGAAIAAGALFDDAHHRRAKR